MPNFVNRPNYSLSTPTITPWILVFKSQNCQNGQFHAEIPRFETYNETLKLVLPGSFEEKQQWMKKESVRQAQVCPLKMQSFSNFTNNGACLFLKNNSMNHWQWTRKTSKTLCVCLIKAHFPQRLIERCAVSKVGEIYHMRSPTSTVKSFLCLLEWRTIAVADVKLRIIHLLNRWSKIYQRLKS